MAEGAALAEQWSPSSPNISLGEEGPTLYIVLRSSADPTYALALIPAPPKPTSHACHDK
jgi:hypothetical protein